MDRIGYSIILYLLAPFIWGYLLLRAIKAPEYRDGLYQRLGLLPKSIASGGIVIHCASVGETMAAKPLINKLIETYSDLPITVTTTTPTGKKSVLDCFGSQVEHIYLPIDWPGSCRRFIQSLKPQIVILMETELWPNLLNRCGQNNIPVLLANARLAKKSLNKYLKHQKLSSELFVNITKIAAQYDADKQNFLALGVEQDKVELVGSIKFDIKLSNQIQMRQSQLKKQWVGSRPVWVAASIHPGEFAQVLNAHKSLLKEIPDLLLIAVPRHPEKFAELKTQCKNFQLPFVSRSDNLVPDKNIAVVVGDTMGEMMLFCGLADIAFVGGSLIERGGHNPLEPVACGLPVVMGPSYYNFSDVCQILMDNDLMQVVTSSDELRLSLKRVLTDKALLASLSKQSINIIQQNSGCVDKMLAQVDLLMSKN